jgi:hypothetical protein
MNAQITRTFSFFEMYVGGENIKITNQNKTVWVQTIRLAQIFDTSIVYAPVFWQMYYAGLRFKIK